MSTLTYVPSLRGDTMLLTHGGDPLLTGAAVLIDAIFDGQLDVIAGRRVVAGPARDDAPVVRRLAASSPLGDVRARVLAGSPASPHEWVHRTAAWAPHRVAAELVSAGAASPLGPRFQRSFSISVDAAAEAAARSRVAGDVALASLLYARGLPTGDPLPPAIHSLPEAVRSIIHAVRSASVGESLAARIAG